MDIKSDTMADSSTKTIYKSWDDGFLVRKMTKSDARLAQEWYCGICPTSIDLEAALESNLHDRGFYVGELNGEVVASAIRVKVADGVYYGSYYYVKEEHRRKGFGRRLRDDVARGHVGENILAIDAHDDLLDMNRRHSYTEDFLVSRFMGKVPVTWETDHLVHTVNISPDKSDSLIKYDNLCFIRPGSSQRKSLLRNWLSIPGSACVAAVNTSGDLIGYGCRRPAIEGDNHIIGPLYADTYRAAYSIVHGLCAGLHGGRVMFDVCLYHQEALQLAATLQLKEDLKMVRMYLNGHPGKLSHRVYGLTSIDVCGF